jgi:heme O synthase-like polyprenyltransferase
MNSVSEQTPIPLAEQGQKAPARRLLADLTELVKVRLTLLVLMTTFVGFLSGWHAPGEVTLQPARTFKRSTSSL